jgi:hypothetical protein
MGPPADRGGSPALIDRPVLEFLRDRLATTGQVRTATVTDTGGHLELRVELSGAYYPDDVHAATLSIRWYTNDDFAIHYRETHDGEDWECRWDRHPNPHHTRAHFHPPPDASTPGEDASWPADYREVTRVVFDEVESRIADLWDE